MLRKQEEKKYYLNVGFAVDGIIEAIINRMEDEYEDADALQEGMYNAIDDELIYTFDQWKILEEYSTPQEASWDDAMMSFYDDCYSAINQIFKEDEDDEEDEENE